MINKTKKTCFLIIAFILLLALINLVSSSKYEYKMKYNDILSYSSDSETFITPFHNYDSFDLCLEKFPQNEIGELNIIILDTDCHESFLYNIANYLLNINKNTTIIYSTSADETEIQKAKDFANLFNLASYSSSEVKSISSSTLFIGKSIPIQKEDSGYFNLSEGESLFYIEENPGEVYIAILGYDSTYTTEALDLLMQTYYSYFQTSDCVIIPSCTAVALDTSEEGKVSLTELVYYLKSWATGGVDSYSMLKAINKWLFS